MAKFRKEGKKEVPQVSTSSLPDIVYMLIFFFMITTTMRDVELKVKSSPLPKASEIQKLEHKALVSSIYIGAPRDTKLGTESRIQLDDAFATTEQIADWIQKKQNTVSKRLVFVIGGPYGFSPEVYARANEKISLSPMTFSHQMVRLIFVEQLYRAYSILNGEPYHHE